jgi:hypothetical protein
MKVNMRALIAVTVCTGAHLAILLAANQANAGATLFGVTGSGGTPSATLHVIDQTDASMTPILPLNDNNGGQVIAYNPDDGFLYHWTGWPQGNALFEKLDLVWCGIIE